MNTTSNTIDTKSSKDEQQVENFEKLELLTTNVIFGTMIVLTVLGTGYLGLLLQEYLSNFEKLRPDYIVPKLQDFYVTFLAMPVLAV